VVCAKNAIALSEIGNEVDVLTCGIPFGVNWEPGMQEIFEASKVRVLRSEDWWWQRLVRLQFRRARLQYYLERFRYCLFSLIGFDGLLQMPGVLRSLRSLDLNQYDCVVTWSPFYSVNLIGAWLKFRRRGTTWVAQFSDPWYLNPLQSRWLMRAYARIFEPATLRFCDGLVHVSRRAQEDLISQWGLKGKKVFVLRHGYLERMYESSKAGRTRRKNSFCMRFVGTLFGRRTPIPLFDALSRILDEYPEESSRLSVSLVGSIEKEFLAHPSLKQLPEGLVQIENQIPYLESLNQMRDCDCLILIEAPVVENRFVPSKLADYLGAGRPIMALSRDAELVEVVRGGGGIVADPENVDEIVEAIMAVLTGNVAAPEMGNATVQLFDSHNCAKELEEFLSSMGGE